MPFTELPSEIHLAVLAKLDYDSLMKMSATNKHFRDLVNGNRSVIKDALIAAEEYQIEHHQRNYALGVAEYDRAWSCYQCLKRLPGCYFRESDLYAVGKHEESEYRHLPLVWLRICMTCGFGNRSNGAGQVFYVLGKADKSYSLCRCEEWIFCGKCNLAKRIQSFYDLRIWRFGKVCDGCGIRTDPPRFSEILEEVTTEVVTRVNRFQEDKSSSMVNQVV